MGDGEIVLVYLVTNTGKKYGHAVFIKQLDHRFFYIYDQGGSRLGTGNYEDLNWLMLPEAIFSMQGIDVSKPLAKATIRLAKLK